VLVVDAKTLLASLTEKTTFAVVEVAPGVPVTVPELALRLKPVGNVPATMLYVYGAAPPLGINGEKLLIAVPAVTLCAVVFAMAVITAEAAPTVKLTVLVVDDTTPLASCTEKTTFAVAKMAVGEPVIAPVLAFRLKPAGNVVEL
jgi:hypothetical protein